MDEARESLLMSAYWKIPLQALVLLVGVLMFLFYVFTPTPMLFNRVHERELRQGPRAQEYAALERRFEGATASRAAAASVAARAGGRRRRTQREAARQEFVARDAEVKAIRGEALALVRERHRRQAYSDVNYVFPTFIVTHMPIGLAGLLIAAIFAAAMSHDFGGAGGALHRHGHRLLPPVLAARRRRRAASCACRASPPGSGACSPAPWRCGPPSSAR